MLTLACCYIWSAMRILGTNAQLCENLLICSKTNFHHLKKLFNDQTLILTDELLDLCSILRNCAGQRPSYVVNIFNWFWPALNHHTCHINTCVRPKKMLINHLLNLIQGFSLSVSDSYKIWCKITASFLHLSWKWPDNKCMTSTNEWYGYLCKPSSASSGTLIHTTW